MHRRPNNRLIARLHDLFGGVRGFAVDEAGAGDTNTLTFNRLDSLRRSALWGYGTAVVAVAAISIGLHMLSSRWQQSPAVSLLLIGVVVSTWLGGARSGLLATALSIMGFNYYFLGLTGSSADVPIQVVQFLSFALVAFYVVWITATERGAAKSLRQAQAALNRNNEVLRAENLEHRRTEEELRASEAKFRALSERAPAAIIVSQGSAVGYANPATSAITGYAADELPGMQLRAATQAAFGDWLKAREQERQSGKPPSSHCELRIVTRTGEERWLDLTEGSFEFGGKPAVVGIALDVTERKRAEEAVRKSERVLREAEELGHTGSWEHDLVTGEIFNTPENLRLFFGEDRSKGARFEDYVEAVHPDDRAYVSAGHEQLLQHGGPRDIEYRVVWPDGTVHTLFGHATVIRDASGRSVRAYGTNVDVTERKRAEEAMRHSQQLLKLVLETLPVGVAVIDKGGDIILSNAAARRIWGEALITSGPDRWARSKGYWHGSSEQIAPAQWPSARALRDGKLTLNELIDIDAFDGRRKTIETSAAPIRAAEGSIVGAVFVIGEVTERVRAERALHDSASRLQQLSRRLIAVQEAERTHLSRELHDEFGQLLATISLHLHAARHAAGEAGQATLDEAMTLLKRAGVQLRTLSLELRPRMLETAGLDSTLRWLAERHQQHTGVATDVVGHVNGVSGDLAIACFRVVQEALTNIARHAGAQHVRIELARSDGTLELTVRDDGVGFDVQRILDGAAGRGNLGLVGMTERVEILGGVLNLESEPGRGTRIRIALPLAAPAARAGGAA